MYLGTYPLYSYNIYAIEKISNGIYIFEKHGSLAHCFIHSFIHSFMNTVDRYRRRILKSPQSSNTQTNKQSRKLDIVDRQIHHLKIQYLIPNT